jgi:hypothetical protein
MATSTPNVPLAISAPHRHCHFKVAAGIDDIANALIGHRKGSGKLANCL